MQKISIIEAATDLGCDINGARLGPEVIVKKLSSNLDKSKIEQDNVIKSNAPNDLKKNLEPLNSFNEKVYNLISKKKNFCLAIGGDHSISIATALASLKKNPNLGLIWIDAHLDYNTFDTTITGNLHGLPLATLNGLNDDLHKFHKTPYFDPKKTVVVGYRAFEDNANLEINNIKTMGVTVYTTNDIKEYGIKKIMENAFKIALKDNCCHVSFDLDVIDPNLAPGVSVPVSKGINEQELAEMLELLADKKSLIKSFDLVEYNPLKDQDEKTLNLAVKIINKIIEMKK